MTLTLQPVGDVRAPLARRNPVAKLGAALLFSLPLIATLDPLTPAVALAIELAVLPSFGVRYRVLARRAWPLVLPAGGILEPGAEHVTCEDAGVNHHDDYLHVGAGGVNGKVERDASGVRGYRLELPVTGPLAVQDPLDKRRVESGR